MYLNTICLCPLCFVQTPLKGSDFHDLLEKVHAHGIIYRFHNISPECKGIFTPLYVEYYFCLCLNEGSGWLPLELSHSHLFDDLCFMAFSFLAGEMILIWVWLLRPVISVCRRPRQGDCKREVNLSDTISSGLSLAMQQETLSKKQLLTVEEDMK